MNNQSEENSSHFKEEIDLSIKEKFIPKRRAPYLMQEERIKQQEESVAHKNQELTQEINNTSLSKFPINNQLNFDLNYHEEVAKLYGLQKKIAHFFVQCCIQRNQNKTGSILLENLSNITGSTKKTIKKVVQRMVDKGLIKRVGGRRGKGGFASFELIQEFIDVIRLQLDLEFNHIATKNIQLSNISIPYINNQNSLPDDWEKIDLSLLIDAFKNSKTKGTQFFGKAQLKIIHTSSKSKLTFLDVQNSINSFAYGLKNYSLEEPYKSMINPAAILLETLKNGDKWEEKRYLSVEENAIYKVYINVTRKVQEDMRLYYKKWKDTDRNKKFDYYKSKMRTTDFYDDKVFEEKAWADYEKNIWPNERKTILIDMMGGIDQRIIDRFEAIQSQ